MTTAAERLVALAGSGGQAGVLLRQIGVAGLTAGALLVAYSGLPTATAAEHLLAERVTAAVAAGSGGGGGSVRPLRPAPRRYETPPFVSEKVRVDNEMFDTALALLLSGLLD